MNEDKRINFGMYFINDKCGWGFEVVDTVENEVLQRGHGFATVDDARAAGFQAAKRIIDEIEKGSNE